MTNDELQKLAAALADCGKALLKISELDVPKALIEQDQQRQALHVVGAVADVVDDEALVRVHVGRVVEQAELLLTHSGGQHRLSDAGMKGSRGIHAYKGMRSNGSGHAPISLLQLVQPPLP